MGSENVLWDSGCVPLDAHNGQPLLDFCLQRAFRLGSNHLHTASTGSRLLSVTARRFAKPPRAGCRPGADMRSSPCARVCLRGALRAPSCAKPDQTPRYMRQNRRLLLPSRPQKASTTTLSWASWRACFASHNSYTKIITQNPVPERECGFKSHLRHHPLWLHRAISETVAGTLLPALEPRSALSADRCRR